MLYYSAVEHIAKTVLLSRWQGSVWAFMSVGSAAYFDESGVDGSIQFPVVAGFVADVDTWIAVERSLHKELGKKPKRQKSKKYLQANHLLFAKICNSHQLQPVHVSIENSVFDLLIEQNHPLAKSYVSCAHYCCQLLDNQKYISIPEPIKVVFDGGTPYQHLLERTHNAYWTSHSRLSRYLSFESEEEVLPLLVSHLYAWLVSRERRNEHVEMEINKSLITIHRTAPLRMYVTQKMILEVSRKMLESERDASK